MNSKIIKFPNMRRVNALKKRAYAQLNSLDRESKNLAIDYLILAMKDEAKNVLHDLVLLSKEFLSQQKSTNPREIFLLIKKIKDERKLVSLESEDLVKIGCKIKFNVS
jgi:hypothetical protein